MRFEPLDDLNIDELFGDPEAVVSTGFRAGRVMRPYRTQMTTSTAVSSALAIAPDGLRVHYRRDGSSSYMQVQTRFVNRVPAQISLSDVRAIPRDERGAVLDTDYSYRQGTVDEVYDFIHEFDFDGPVVDRARTLDLLCQYEFNFSVVVATVQFNRIDVRGNEAHRHELPIRISRPDPVDGMPGFEIDCALHTGYRSGPFLGAIVQLAERTPSLDRSRELILTLYGEDDLMLGRETRHMRLPSTVLPIAAKDRFDVPGAQLRRATRLEIRVSGTVDRIELLGSFPLSRGD